MTGKSEIGLIGLGNAGKPLAARLLTRGYPMAVYDLNRATVSSLAELGAVPAASAGEATKPITLTVLPSSLEVREVYFGANGIGKSLQPGFIYIDLSGTDPDCAREIERDVNDKRAFFLGGTLHAHGAPAITIPAGVASIAIGGKRETVEACSDLLRDLAQKVICLPEPWMPKALKIAVIMFSTVSSILNAEVCTWLLAQGIAPKLLLQLLRTTGSQASATRLEEFMQRNNADGGALSNSYKDIRQALKVASQFHVPLPLIGLASQIQEMGRAQGLARKNSPQAIGALYELLSGRDLSEAALDTAKTLTEAREPEIIYLETF
jgi:3-hydroxyisobutyrate dehydrogenase